jgi:hypothetical protein
LAITVESVSDEYMRLLQCASAAINIMGSALELGRHHYIILASKHRQQAPPLLSLYKVHLRWVFYLENLDGPSDTSNHLFHPLNPPKKDLFARELFNPA